MNEFIHFAKDMLSQKPSRHLLKVYLVGSVFAVLGTVIGLIEMASQPFSSAEPMDAEMLLVMPQEQKTVAPTTQCKDKVPAKWEEQEEDMIQGMTFTKVYSQRSLSKRLHASRS